MLMWIPLLPLLGFAVNGFWYAFAQAGVGRKKASSELTGGIATAAILGSFLVSSRVALELFNLPVESRMLEQHLFQWMQFQGFSLDFSFRVDALNSLFLLVITGVGSLIHIYSIGYMHEDESPGRFFAYLNLFCFAMLILVLGASLPVMFLGWEGVGLCSYLLIGYWYSDTEKAMAGMKAFVVNRIGDFGFILAAFWIFTQFGSLDFEVLRQAVAAKVGSTGFSPEELTAITGMTLLLFLGCTGKSAQIPLYVWLPDAMAGPTPVSALIHAATMVTSGIYLLTRLNFLVILSPSAMLVIAWTGALTAFFAATIAFRQTDIKKVLAYSTVSQLGYMFLGCGVGAFDAGVFHVMTHAFFKALLFLGAGSVIHGMHHEQDMLKMGGLRKSMPKTFSVFAIGWIAICGIPPFAGFFSKDEILWRAFESSRGSWALWLVAAMTAVMTAFYMTRMFWLTFMGESRNSGHGAHKAHESPMIMVGPLYVLALLSMVGGWIGIPHMSWLEHWLEPILESSHHLLHAESALHEAAGYMEWVLMAVSVLGAIGGILLAREIYQDYKRGRSFESRMGRLGQLVEDKWKIDELYHAVFVGPLIRVSRIVWRAIDVGVIDRFVLGLGRGASWTGSSLRVLSNGSVQTYAILGLFGLLVTLGYLFYGMV